MASLLFKPTLVLGLLAAHSLAIPAPLPTATAPPVKRDELSCWDKASDGLVFEAANAQWDIICGTDYAGGDMGTSWVASFEECIQDCDTTSGCVDVSFVWPNACYKKNTLNAAVAADSVWTARRKSSGTSTSISAPLSCEQGASDGVQYTSAKGTFLIECGLDYAGGDMGSSSTASFEACIEDCASTDGCIDVSYVYGACYKKDVLNEPVSLQHVWSAKLVSSDTDASSTATITSAPASTDSATATATPVSCPASNGTTLGMSTGGTYEILCQIDYAGGDFKEVDTPTFEECLEACDNNDGCVALSYVAPSCYLKSELMTPVAVSYVWGAVIKKAAKDLYAFPTVADQALEPGATESIMAEPMTLESPPLATLAPVPPPGVNMGGLRVLTPDPTTELWYNGDDDAMNDEDSGAVTVRLTIEYKYPSVVLDHSVYISAISCGNGILTATFSERTPLLHAAEQWPSQAPILLISSAASCGNGEQNAFWLASSVTFDLDAMTFSAPGETVELADVYNNMDIDFGNLEYETDADNGTATDDGTDSCGSPGSPFLDDLPAVACGADFDKTLDDALGYYSATFGDNQQLVLAAAGVPAEDDTAVAKRGWFSSLVRAVAKVVVAVAKVVAVVVEHVAQAVVQVVQKAVEVVKVVVQAVVAVSIAVVTQVAKLAVFIATGNYSNSLTLPVNLGPPSSVLAESPWGSTGFKFYEYTPEEGGSKWEASEAALERIQTELIGEADPEPGIELWCVDCGVRGKIVATGSLSATPLSGLKKGTIGISGNMYAGVFLGVNAFTQWEKTVRKDLFVKGLPGWSIPGIVSLGPRLILAAQATISVEAEGQILTGASLNWPNFQATLDFVDKSHSSQSGWTPELTKKFEAHGEVTATAALGLPVIVNFDINILNGVFEKGINLTDFPAITAEASFEIEGGTDNNQVGSDECEGIDWDISLTNELRLDISDGPGFTLKQWASPALASGCIGRSRDGDDSDDESATTTTPAAPEPTVEDLSLRCPAADGTTYTDVGLNTYAIKCDTDAPGSDIAVSLQSNFDDCINYCASVSGCAGVAWIPSFTTQNNCYAKSTLASTRSDASAGYAIHLAVMNSPFVILSMIYSDRDVTAAAANNIVRANSLVIDTNTISSWAGDPWPGNAKSIFLLYMYGAETRTFVSTDGQGVFTISPGAVYWPSEIVPSYGQHWGVYNLQVVGVAYGRNAISSYNVWSNVYWSARYAGQWQFTNNNFQWDTWVGVVKSGVIWYKDLETGYFYAMAVRENNYGGFAQVKARKRDLISAGSHGGNGTLSNSTVTSSIASTPTPASSLLLSDVATPAGSDFPQMTPVRSGSNSTASPGFSHLTVTNSTADATSSSGSAQVTPANTTGSSDFPQLAVTNSTANSTADFPQLAVANGTVANTTNSTNPLADMDVSLFRVTDSTNTLSLNAGVNGNLFLSVIGDPTDLSNLTTGALLAGTSASADGSSAPATVLFGDASGRLLHYYPDVAARTGVSRLRLAPWHELPTGARLVSLVPAAGAADVAMLLAIDHAAAATAAVGAPLWPFFCGIRGQLNKVFLAADPDGAAAALEAVNMKYTVTGGEAYSCSPLALVATAA